MDANAVLVPETRINLIENQTHVKTYRVTGPLSQDVSSLILDTILPIIKMKVIHSFSCTIYRGQNQAIQYCKMLSPNVTFTSLSQIEEYIRQCELWCLNLDDREVCCKAYLPVMRITDNHSIYEEQLEFWHIQVQLIPSKEPLLGCSPLPDWLCKKWCIYLTDNEGDNLSIWQCLAIANQIRSNQTRLAEDTMRDALKLAHEF